MDNYTTLETSASVPINNATNGHSYSYVDTEVMLSSYRNVYTFYILSIEHKRGFCFNTTNSKSCRPTADD